jgi:hypothetical protein
MIKMNLSKSTKDSVLWNVKSGETDVGDIEVDFPGVESLMFVIIGFIHE